MAGSFLDFGSLETGSGGSDGEDEKPRRAAKPKRSRKFPPPEMDPEMIPDLRSLLVKYKPRSLTHAKAILKEAWDGIPRSEIPRKESAYINFVTKMNPKVAKKYRALKWTNKERMDHIASLWNKGITDISDEEAGLSEGEAESDEGEAEKSEEDKDEAEQSEEDKDEAEQSEEEHGEDEEEILAAEARHGEEELPVLPVLPFKTTKQEKHKHKKEKKERKKEKKERKKEKKEKKAKKEKSSESASESESEPEQELSKKRKFEATKM